MVRARLQKVRRRSPKGENIADFLDLVNICDGKNLYIQTHNFPDQDAIASAFGLQQLLLIYGISSKICYDGHIDKLSTARMADMLHIQMLSLEKISHLLCESDAIICVDCQKYSGNTTDFTGEEIACIDHHPTYTAVSYRYVDIQEVGACSTIITEYYQRLGIVPTTETATALLHGIKMDTLHFTRGVTEKDIAAFSFLFPLIDASALEKLDRNNIELHDLKAYGAAIENIKLSDYVGFSRIPFACPDAMIASARMESSFPCVQSVQTFMPALLRMKH